MHIDRILLRSELCRITTLPHDLRGMKMVPTNAIVVLALVVWLNYIWLCRKHQSDRMRKEITEEKEEAPS